MENEATEKCWTRSLGLPPREVKYFTKIIEDGGPNNQLYSVIWFGNVPVMKCLLMQGADPDSVIPPSVSMTKLKARHLWNNPHAHKIDT
jgi:hypothetical protein